MIASWPLRPVSGGAPTATGLGLGNLPLFHLGTAPVPGYLIKVGRGLVVYIQGGMHVIPGDGPCADLLTRCFQLVSQGTAHSRPLGQLPEIKAFRTGGEIPFCLRNMALLVIAVVSSLVLYEIVWIVYQLWFSPLASIPGPFLARISNLWLTY